MSGANAIDGRASPADRFLTLAGSDAFCVQWDQLAAARGAFVGRCASLAEAYAASRETPIALLIVDAGRLPVMQVLHDAALPALRKATKILIAEAPCGVDEELAALAAGISGCCASDLGHEELGTVIDVVLKGGIWVSRRTLPLLLSRLQEGAKLETHAPPVAPREAGGLERAWSTLTRREREVALRVAEGASNKIIAGTCNLTDATIKAHLTSIYHKLGVTSRVQLALLLSGMLRRRPELTEHG